MKTWWFIGLVVVGLALWYWLPQQIVPETVALPKVQVRQLEQGLEFRLEGKLPSNLPWQVWLSTNAGAILGAGRTGQTLLIPWTRAGITPYRVQIGDFRIRGEIERFPQSAITPLDANIGARAVRVNANRVPALVLYPTDALGNISNDPIKVQINRPDGTQSTTQIQAKHLLAWQWLPPGRQTGILKVQVSSPSARGERGEVDVLPNLTSQAQFLLQTSTTSTERERLRFTVRNATDRFGNPVLNGTSTEFTAQNATWALFATRALVRQSAEILLPVPEQGTFQGKAFLETWKSQTVRFRVTPNIRLNDFPVRLNNNVLEVGEVVDQQGALLDDGTAVRIEVKLSATNAYTISLPLENGRLRWQLPPLPMPPKGQARVLQISIEGSKKFLKLP